MGDNRGSVWRRAAIGIALLPPAALGVALALSAVAPAQEAGVAAPGRFDMHPSGEGVLRLDRVTGAIALCAADGGAGWSCRTVVEAEVAEPPRTAVESTAGAGAVPAAPDSAAADRRAAATRERIDRAREDAARRLGDVRATAGQETTQPRTSAAAAEPETAATGRQPDERRELDRLRQENARLTARVDELERRLAEVATVARAGGVAGSAGTDDAETDEAIAGIDRAVRVGIYAIARFRELAELLASEEADGQPQ